MAMASSVKDESQRNIITIHAQLIQELSKYISPTIKPTWNEFRNNMQIYIARADLALCIDVFTTCDKLFEQGDIAYGKYDVLSKAFQAINHQVCYAIVVKYTKQIQEVQAQPKDEAMYLTWPAGEHRHQGKVEEKEAEVTERKLQDIEKVEEKEAKVTERKLQEISFQAISAKLTIGSVEPDMSEEDIYDIFLYVFNIVVNKTSELPIHAKAERLTDLINVKEQFRRLLERLRKDQIHMKEMTKGSLKLLFIVKTRKALHKLWHMYQCGELLAMLQKGFVSEDLLKFCKADSIQLRIQIAEEDYLECLTKMGKVVEKEVNVTDRELEDLGKVERKEVKVTERELQNIAEKVEEKEVHETEKKLKP